MFRHILTKRLATAFAAAGLLAIAQFSAPALVTAAPSIEHVDYTPDVVTTTNLTLDRGTVFEGQKNTAHAKVSAGSGKPTGTVTFTVAGHEQTVTLSPGGTANYAMPTDLAPGTYKVTAQYNGDGVYRPSSDTAYVTVRERGKGHVGNGPGSQNPNSGGAGGTGENGGNGGGKGRPAPTTGNGGGILGEQTTGGLPGTGSDSSTMLYGLGGLVLLGAGGVALAMNRRRNHA